ncbi:MAG: DUF3343 domain-containing protein [Mogibacterium sp.]|nr:DUF3343 domain-containing protein [Mogibacterium sp.]
MTDEYYLYTFESTHGAISTERLLKPLGCIVMPVPRAISTSCGIAVRVEPDRIEATVDAFRAGSDLAAGEFQIYHIRSDKSQVLFEYEPFDI